MISSRDYDDLNGTSDIGGSRRDPGIFVKVFISGQPRDGMKIGHLQAIYPQLFDKSGDEKFLVNNKEAVYFIPLFIKKIREGYTKINNRDQLTYFSWNPDNDSDYPKEARCAYLFGGLLLNDDLKPVRDKFDSERTAFVYFKNDGSKMGNAIEYINSISKKSEELEPISDDKAFERSIITPKRFIVKVTIGIAKTDYGNKNVFKYELFKQLPDNAVKDIVDKAKKWLPPFNKQFDNSEYVKSSQQRDTSRNRDVSSEGVNFDNVNASEGVETLSEAADLDLGI